MGHTTPCCLSLSLPPQVVSCQLLSFPQNPSCFGDLTAVLPAPSWCADVKFSSRRLGKSTASATATSPGVVPFYLPPCVQGGGTGRHLGPVSRGMLWYQATAVDDFPHDLKRDQTIPTRKNREGGTCLGEPQSPTCVRSLGCRQTEDPPAWVRSDTGLPSAVATKANPAQHPQLRLPQPPGCPGARAGRVLPSHVPSPACQVCRDGYPQGKQLTFGFTVDHKDNRC